MLRARSRSAHIVATGIRANGSARTCSSRPTAARRSSGRTFQRFTSWVSCDTSPMGTVCCCPDADVSLIRNGPRRSRRDAAGTATIFAEPATRCQIFSGGRPLPWDEPAPWGLPWLQVLGLKDRPARLLADAAAARRAAPEQLARGLIV